MEGLCDNCGKRKAETGCEVCGAKVCQECKLRHGCKRCNGGEMTFD
jgi:hypothetical protein